MSARWLVAMVTLLVPVVQAQNAEIAVTISDGHGKALADAVVIAVPADGSIRLPARRREDIVDQVNKEFLPKVQAVLIGTAVTFPNHDTVRHQVYSFCTAKRSTPVFGSSAGRRVRQAGRRGSRLQHPRLDGRLRVRFGVTVLREDRCRRQGDAERLAPARLRRARVAPATRDS